ncbi:flagellin domain protein [Solidesulfovibrio carbinoliphilus subsp. oakridgensis]|uniref:Flagellin n=1 Tax=Solidesulfovibrio carbinoliphilus subsp. oakridgensis TaxID=694327 RepID=G7Q747_9BACT|nr:flagellin domain protein [Solidesulfovibrio carbinoliphilus subsp. oakridgensis]
MSLVINHNLMAINAARNLSNSYGALATSTRRLSSGLRINGAADDAAGLAIRELMRSDVSTMNQGIRNANDAVSLIQTADGALQVVDEKLIRMKELAEQAATGTYTSDQRLIIDSEYQAMASEITRIAMATDFNGIHLLNGNLSSIVHMGNGLSSAGKLKVHFGTGNNSSEDYYYVQIENMTAEALSLGSNATAEDAISRISGYWAADLYQTFKPLEESGDITTDDFNELINDYPAYLSERMTEWSIPTSQATFDAIRQRYLDLPSEGYPDSYVNPPVTTWDEYQALDSFAQEKIKFQWARAAATKLGNYIGAPDPAIPSAPASISPYEFTSYSQSVTDSTDWFLDKYDYSGNTIRTQEDAQNALDAISKAIINKDKARASLGAVQNRLENTISNLQIQAENLMASESQISDVDVASEMTEFVRQQILTQAAVAMLAQANSLPKMAMQLISG